MKIDLTQKSRLVTDGHRTPDPVKSTNTGMVSQESARITLTYAALIGINVWGPDIQNTYLSGPTSEKFWIICRHEFGSELRTIVKRVFYGTKNAGRDFCNHLRDCMHHLGIEPCRADPDKWLRITKLDNGAEY